MTRIFRLSPWALAALLVAAGCSDGEQRLPPGQNNNASNNSGDPDAGSVDPDSGVAVDAGTPDSGVVVPTSEVETMDLGEVTLAAGDSPEITFDLPAEAVSFMITVTGPDETNFVIKRMFGPNDEVLVSDDESTLTQIERFLLGPFAAQFKSPNRVVQDLGSAAFMFPNNPSIQVGGGTYRMVLSGLTIQGQSGLPYTGQVQVGVQYRTVRPQGGLLHLTLHFTGAGGIDAAGAQSDPLIQGAIDEMRNIYAQANVQIGDIAYLDSDSRFRTMEIGAGGVGLLEEMFQTTSGGGPGLHFFFVDRFEGGLPGGMVAGISGGLPGPGLAPGTVNSGVAVGLASIGNDPGVLAHVMAHEGGHWLGLFHTSEITGTEDQMPDTPSGQGGQNHLMYPAVGGGTTLSPSQCDILRRHSETIAQ